MISIKLKMAIIFCSGEAISAITPNIIHIAYISSAACLWLKPTSNNKKCKCPLSAVKGDLPANILLIADHTASIIGTPSTKAAVASLAPENIAIIPRLKPKKYAPESPLNIYAG